MIIFLNDYMIFLPMLMYSNVNQALKHRMLAYNFFFLMLGIEWSIVRLLHSPFPHCPLKEAIRPTQMEPCEGLQIVWGACCPWSVKIHGRRARLLVLDPLASGPSQTSCWVFQGFLISSLSQAGENRFCHGSPFSPTNLSTLFTSLKSILFVWNSPCFHFPQIFFTQLFLSSTSVASRSLCQSWFP